MKIIDATKKQVVFIVFFCVILIWTGWFLWQDAGRRKTENGDSNADKQYETLKQSPRLKNDPPPQFGIVTDVVDSLTIIIDDAYLVRYLGVSTPATLDRVECFGKESVQANESMLGKTVRLEEDPVLVRARDGASIRYVWGPDDDKSQEAYAMALNGMPVPGLTEPLSSPKVSGEPTTPKGNNDSGDSGGEPVNVNNKDEAVLPDESGNAGENVSEKLGDAQAGDTAGMMEGVVPEPLNGDNEANSEEKGVEEEKIKEYLVSERIIEMGLGFPLLGKEMMYYDRLSSAARYSSATKRGLWGQCEISQDNESGLLNTQTVEECNIKGVIISNGDKIYRTSSCAGYKDMVVLLYKGGKWLCSEEEAVSSGYVKAVDCK